jgi:hypothetical protein
MKKIIGIALAMVFASVVLTGCYTKGCEPPCPVPYKDCAR